MLMSILSTPGTWSAGSGGAVKGIDTGGRWSSSGRTRRTKSPTVAVDSPCRTTQDCFGDPQPSAAAASL